MRRWIIEKEVEEVQQRMEGIWGVEKGLDSRGFPRMGANTWILKKRTIVKTDENRVSLKPGENVWFSGYRPQKTSGRFEVTVGEFRDVRRFPNVWGMRSINCNALPRRKYTGGKWGHWRDWRGGFEPINPPP